MAACRPDPSDRRRRGAGAWPGLVAPTNPALTVRQMVTRFAEVNDALAPKLTSIPYPVMWTLGLFTPPVKELRTTRYQFTRPFVIDSSATTDVLGLKPITLEVALRDAAARLRA